MNRFANSTSQKAQIAFLFLDSFVKPVNDASHAWRRAHNVCDRPVPSAINSVRWSTSPCFLEGAAVPGGNRRYSNWEEARARLDLAEFQ